ncbi:hypothetical protein C8Q77DRAFT_1161385 [Trametes polyzona]|nr:hypothetical protein C8Q77DRAFT_1161385 [Trametes polyzona]
MEDWEIDITSPRRSKKRRVELGATKVELQYPQFFLKNPKGAGYRCILCTDWEGYKPLSKAIEHEFTDKHTRRIRALDRPADPGPPSSPSHPVDDLDVPDVNVDAEQELEGMVLALDHKGNPQMHSVDDLGDSPRTATRAEMLVDYDNVKPSADDTNVYEATYMYNRDTTHRPALEGDNPEQLYDNWGGALATLAALDESAELDTQLVDEEDENEETATFQRPGLSEDATPVEETGLSWKDALGGRIPGEDPLDGDVHVHSMPDQHLHAPDLVEPAEDEDIWWPWPNRETCLLDVTGAFPRALFSESELRAARWLAEKTGARSLPTLRQVKRAREAVLKVAGSEPRIRQGHCGHVYASSNFEKVIEHEFANPVTRSILDLYPEDGQATELKHPRQVSKWAKEIDPALAAPMARAEDGRDYFIRELALANVDGSLHPLPVVIARWFRKGGVLISKAHPVLLHQQMDGEPTQRFVIDMRAERLLEIPLTSYLCCVDDLLREDVRVQWGLPHPGDVYGAITSSDTRTPLESWNEPVRNEWRVRANGKPVYSLPIWLYCDDTSGNVSKKWNKHNSILFVLGGLPREATQKVYNVHFLSTSNIASPLEMMEHLSAVLRSRRAHGITVWDCQDKLDALVIPWVLAFQGDNPMASEFASHIGMQGKYFCRVCHVCGSQDEKGDHTQGEVRRLTDFMKAGEPRSKEETIGDLEEQEKRVLEGAPSAVDTLATETGSKDKYFQHFVDILQVKLTQWRDDEKRTQETRRSTTSKSAASRKDREQAFLRDLRENMPTPLHNPVLDIPDFDPNSDSPVEILHVVLLGVVKYWWRDACARQDNRVGRDFRVVLQVAPAVLQGLVPEPAYQAWLALCRLAPLLFQPEIDDLPSYKVRLNDAVEDFLLSTALWTSQWFNKPKFHLFVHLLLHVERFGPAALYSTETFESYNLVIRLRSINSNKHAPSIDIARSFSHVHAVRHLLRSASIIQKKCPPVRYPGRPFEVVVQEAVDIRKQLDEEAERKRQDAARRKKKRAEAAGGSGRKGATKGEVPPPQAQTESTTSTPCFRSLAIGSHKCSSFLAHAIFFADTDSLVELGASDIPVANAFPSVPDRSLGATGISVEDIEVMLRAMSLDAERGTVLRFNQMHVNEKLTVLFMHVLRLSHDIKEVALHAVDTDRRLDHIENLSQRAWQPSKAQNKLFRSLVRHFLIKPISSYQTLPEYIKNYIVDNAKKLRLGLYLVDKTVKATVNECINDITTQMKSAFRKAVFASCNNKIPLHSFARNMVDNYHLPAIPADIPVAILGTMALMREIAEPLAKQPNSKKGDTGFWSGVQEELDNLYETFKSNDRYSNPEWLRWASDKVKEDARRFPVGRGRFAAATREELDQALGSSGNPENRDVDILGNGDGASHNGDQDMDEEDMDGDVELSAMGDVAATVQMDAA